MTNREAIAVIKEGLKKVNADNVYTNKGIWLKLKAVADLLIKKDADSKLAFYRLNNIFTPVYVDTIEVSPLEDSCLSNLPIDCKVCRTKNKLPKFVETTFGMLYKAITSVDNSISFTLVTQSEYNVKRKIKYNTSNYAWIENGYMYFSKCFPCIKIIGYFSEPNISKTDGNCSILDQGFPCPDYLLNYALEETLKVLGVGENIINDNVSNKNTNPQII